MKDYVEHVINSKGRVIEVSHKCESLSDMISRIEEADAEDAEETGGRAEGWDPEPGGQHRARERSPYDWGIDHASLEIDRETLGLGLGETGLGFDSGIRL